MSFDLIETTVANAILLRAAFDHDPVDLKLELENNPEIFQEYEDSIRSSLSLQNIYKEPLGKHQFKQYLKSYNAESRIDLVSDIMDYQKRKHKDRVSKSKYILSKYLLRAVGNQSEYDLVVSHLVLSEIKIEDFKSDDEESPPNSPDGLNVPETGYSPSSGSVSDNSPSREILIQKKSEDIFFPKSKGDSPKEDDSHKDRESLSEKRKDGRHNSNSAIRTGSDRNEPPESRGRQKLGTSVGSVQSMSGPFAPKPRTPSPREPVKPPEAETKTGEFLDQDDEYKEADSQEEYDEENEEKLANLGIPESMIELTYKKWKEGITQRQIPSDLFDDVLSTIQLKIQTDDFPEFLRSDEYKHYIMLRHYTDKSTVSFNDFQIFRVLGKGAFGAVHAVRKVDTKKIYAMKEMEKKKVKFHQSEKMCLTERNILSSLSSPFTLNLKYSFSNKDSLFLVTDICQGGDLQYHLSEAKDNCFDEVRTKFYCSELVLAVEHIHSLEYVYRDLKPGNVLLDETGHLMLSDLGLVHKLSSRKPLTTLAGTAGYWAPEVMMRKTQNKTIDWWSFGIFIFKLLTGRRPKCSCSKKEKEWCPFGSSDDHESNAKAGCPMKFSLDFSGEVFSEEAKDILTKLLDPTPSTRLGARGAKEIKNHPWFASIDWDKLENRELRPPYVPRKGEVHAATLAEIGETDANLNKFRRVQLTPEDEEFYKKWEYKSITAVQEELVWTLKRNARVKRKQTDKNSKKFKERNITRGCCVLQ